MCTRMEVWSSEVLSESSLGFQKVIVASMVKV